MLKLISFLAIFNAANAWFGEEKGDWFNLKTKFPLYYDEPRTVEEAKSKNYVQIGDCNDKSNFQGIRYGRSRDEYDVATIYDVNGFIAGIQSVIPLDEVPEELVDYYADNSWYQKGKYLDKDVYFTTAYFVDPKIICKKGRTLEEFKKEGTGNTLTFQVGPNYGLLNRITPPIQEKNISEKGPVYYKHKCFVGMGNHYMRFNYKKNQDCKKVWPIQIMYKDNELNGFVWQHIGKFKGSRYEHPGGGPISLIVKDGPDCLYDYAKKGYVSTMHVWVRSPWETCLPKLPSWPWV